MLEALILCSLALVLVCAVDSSVELVAEMLSFLGLGKFPLRAGVKEGERSGLQRLQALKPSFAASLGVVKKTMLARRARRDGQVGKQ